MDFNKLWQNFMDTLQNHYMDFNGRMGRAQFWYYVLVSTVIFFIAAIIGSFTIRLLSTLVSLALLLPNLGMIVRRLHDTGKPGIYVLILLVPAGLMLVMGVFSGLALLVGGGLAFLMVLAGFGTLIFLATLAALAIMIYFCAQPGAVGNNEYGPPSPIWTPN